MAEDDREVERAQGNVRRFGKHLLAYVAITFVVFVTNMVMRGFWYGHPWVFVILLAWGTLVGLQGVRLFGEVISRARERRRAEGTAARRWHKVASRSAQTSATDKPGSRPAQPRPPTHAQ